MRNHPNISERRTKSRENWSNLFERKKRNRNKLGNERKSNQKAAEEDVKTSVER